MCFIGITSRARGSVGRQPLGHAVTWPLAKRPLLGKPRSLCWSWLKATHFLEFQTLECPEAQLQKGTQ